MVVYGVHVAGGIIMLVLQYSCKELVRTSLALGLLVVDGWTCVAGDGRGWLLLVLLATWWVLSVVVFYRNVVVVLPTTQFLCSFDLGTSGGSYVRRSGTPSHLTGPSAL